MNFEVNVAAGLIAGLVAMVPGSIVYSPMTATGKLWMKEAGLSRKKLSQGMSPMKAMTLMLLTSFVSGAVASLFVSSSGASSVVDALDVCLLLVWFPIAYILALSFFEGRSWMLSGINILNQVLTFASIGIVLGLFL